MKQVSEPEAFRAACQEARDGGRAIGFVPTMGALHPGHLSLIERARSLRDWVAVSIFVNPTQFGPNEDLDRYPRSLEQDLRLCEEHGVDLVFTPNALAMYPREHRTRVRVSELTDRLCGAARPDHFEGVCTVVSQLFHLSGPCLAVFGRKDYQQCKVVERMVQDLFLPVEILEAPIVREPDGLALSSRNLRLSPEQRRAALGLVRGLVRSEQAWARGECSAAELERVCREELQRHDLVIDYVTVADPESLAAIDEVGTTALLAVAAFAGDVRLIDNLVLGEDRPPDIAESP